MVSQPPDQFLHLSNTIARLRLMELLASVVLMGQFPALFDGLSIQRDVILQLIAENDRTRDSMAEIEHL